MRTRQLPRRHITKTAVVDQPGYEGGSEAHIMPPNAGFRVSTGNMWGFGVVSETTYIGNGYRGRPEVVLWPKMVCVDKLWTK